MSIPRDQQRKQKRQRAQVIAKALRNRDETREKLLAQGRELARRRKENIEREQHESSSNGTNPSLYSTIPPRDSNEQAAARHSHSTVPERPKGSTVPAADRLYGLRLYEEIRPDREQPSDASTDGQIITDASDEATESKTTATDGGDR